MKLTLPFNWEFELPSVVAVQFQLDLSRANDDSGELSEYPCFFIDLATGELLMVDDVISSGIAYRYERAENWLIEGKGWWAGYSDSDQEEKIQVPDEIEGQQLLDLFGASGKGAFNKLVDLVCELGRNKDLSKLSKVTGLYPKLIGNDDAPSLG